MVMEMVKSGNIAYVAKLFNNKKVLIDTTDLSKGSASYRYLTQDEIEQDTLNTNKKYIWLETPVRTTKENMFTIVFINVDSTPIVLYRFPS